MRAKEELPECPVATAVSLIGGKWKLLILRNLKERPWRFNELQRSIDGMNQPILKYCNEIRSAVLIVHGEKAHSYYFGKDAYENMIKDSKYTSNKELLTIPGNSDVNAAWSSEVEEQFEYMYRLFFFYFCR